jgi:hypothetical protein
MEKMDQRSERLFKKRPACQKIAAGPGGWDSHGQGHSSGGILSAGFSKWPTHGRMAGSSSKTTFKRRKNTIRTTLQVGKSLSPNTPDPGEEERLFVMLEKGKMPRVSGQPN